MGKAECVLNIYKGVYAMLVAIRLRFLTNARHINLVYTSVHIV